MKQGKNYLANTLDIAGEKARYDAEVKKILSDKRILAWILQYCVQEFSHTSIADIMTSIIAK